MNPARLLYAGIHEFLKRMAPGFILNPVRERRFYFLYKHAFDKKLRADIESSNTITSEMVDETMRKHNMACRWGATIATLNGRPSDEYVSEAFYYSQALPRMNRLQFVKAYTDKNLYHHLPFGAYTPDVLVRKISGRYYDENYRPLGASDIKSIIDGYEDEIVIKPSIESGAGYGVWVGSSAEAYQELMDRNKVDDIVVQPRLYNDPSLALLNPTSLNTFKIITAFTGTQHVLLGGHLRIGRIESRTDNTGSGGVAPGMKPGGAMHEKALGAKFRSYDRHPDSGIVFKDHVIERYDEIVDLCCDLHRYFPHFGLIGWDATIDDKGALRIIEFNLDWHGIQIAQFAHGPLFGAHRDEIRKTYNIPEWRGRA